ncbi:MAG: hypothetical protein ABIJ08_02315 [Nanoarchaeota archaeon]
MGPEELSMQVEDAFNLISNQFKGPHYSGLEVIHENDFLSLHPPQFIRPGGEVGIKPNGEGIIPYELRGFENSAFYMANYTLDTDPTKYFSKMLVVGADDGNVVVIYSTNLELVPAESRSIVDWSGPHDKVF